MAHRRAIRARRGYGAGSHARRTIVAVAQFADGIDITGPVQAEVFVVWLNGDHLEAHGTVRCGTLDDRAGRDRTPGRGRRATRSDGRRTTQARSFHVMAPRPRRRDPELRRRHRRRARWRHGLRADLALRAGEVDGHRGAPLDRLRTGRGAWPAAHGLARSRRSGRCLRGSTTAGARCCRDTCPSPSGRSAEGGSAVGDGTPEVRLRTRCSCGWEIAGNEDEVVAATIDHGLRVHNMAATRDEVLASAERLDPAESARGA